MVISTLEELKSMKLKPRDTIYVKCDICGKVFKTRAKRSDLHCKGCKTFLVKTANGTLKHSEETKKKISESTKGRKVYVSEMQKEKRRKTCKERYGGEPLANKEIRDKIKNTNILRYGNEFFVKSDVGRKTLSEASKAAATKRRKTCEVLYGVPAATLKDGCKKKYTYDNIQFDSKWEMSVWIFYKEHGAQIERFSDEPFIYEYAGVKHRYYPDFKLNGECIEVKGPHFFENGKMVNPFDRSQDGIFEAKHQCALANGVKFITDCSLYLNYVKEKYTEDFLDLFKNDAPFPYPELGSGDMGVIRFCHRSIYQASRLGKKSPYEAWQDKNLVKISALNRLKYVGSCTPRDVVAGFSVAKIAPKVTIFKSSLAQHILEKYAKEFNTICDPFSGFSGRCVGAARCGKKYYGFDINEAHVQESLQVIKMLHLKDCHVKVEDILSKLDTSEYECLFTCPPYGGKEHWDINSNEVEKSCDEWIDICLEKYKCKKYIFVIDKTEKYKNYIVEDIKNVSHFGKNFEHIVIL